MASSGPVPVTIFSNDGAKKTTSKKPRNTCPYKFINKIDGPGQYMRFAFFAESLDEGNSVLAEFHNAKIIDSVYSHAYSRNKNGKSGYSIHGIAHLSSRDYDFNFMRKKFSRASLRVSFYPEGTYPSKNPQKPVQANVQCVQEGAVPNCYACGPVAPSFGELPNENSFGSFN